MSDLSGKIAMVAAASSGLGKAVAMRLAACGAEVAICGRDAQRLAEAAEDIMRETGRNVLTIAADVGKGADIERFLEQTLSIGGCVDILVTNAGGPPAGKFEDFDDKAWYAAHEQNFMSVVRLIRGVLPGMKERRAGSILNIISSSVKQPIPGLILSNVYRPAIVGLAKTLSEEVAPYGIRVNNIAPGTIDTRRIQSLHEKRAKDRGMEAAAVRQEAEAAIPMGRIGTPAEFANAAAFLVSAEASYITGVTLQVDGGSIRSLL